MLKSIVCHFLSVGAVASAFALAGQPARAGDISGSLPEFGTRADNGIDFNIINPANGAGGAKMPVAIKGSVTGTGGFGVFGDAKGTGGTGIFALSSGANSFGLKVINVGVSNDFSADGIAGYFEIRNRKSTSTQAAVYGLAAGGRPNVFGDYGSAAVFTSSNAFNLSPVVRVLGGPTVNAIAAFIGGDGEGGGTAVSGSDNATNGGFGVAGSSFKGFSGYFAHGSGGNGICSYNGGPDWNCPSDRKLKDHFAAVDLDTLLDRLEAMPVFYYQMKGSVRPTRYLGPTAQDFKTAFDLGDSDTMINGANAKGVALAAAKGLYRKLKQDEAVIAAQKAVIAADHQTILAIQRELVEQKAVMANLQAGLTQLPRRGVIREARARPGRE